MASEPGTTCISFEVVVLGRVGSWAFLGFTGTTARSPRDLRITPESREWEMGWHGGSEELGRVRSAECVCTARSPWLVLSSGLSFFQGSRLKPQLVPCHLLPQVVRWSHGLWLLPAGHAWGQTKGRGWEGREGKTSPVSLVSILKGQPDHSAPSWPSGIPVGWRPAVPQFPHAVGHSPGGFV